MRRRHAILALAGAAVPLALATSPARAAASDIAISAGDYTLKTLQFGTVAKLTSLNLLQRSHSLLTRTFARLEVIEQTAAAQALTSNFAPPPPRLTATQQAVVNTVLHASDSALDFTYITVQIAGHQELLRLQRGLLAGDANPADDIVHVALLLRSNIDQHIDLLKEILPKVAA